MNYIVRGRSAFEMTGVGRLGMVLLLLGAPAGAIFAALYYRASLDVLSLSALNSSLPTWQAVTAGLCGFAALIGMVMLFVGRSLRHEIMISPVHDPRA